MYKTAFKETTTHLVLNNMEKICYEFQQIVLPTLKRGPVNTSPDNFDFHQL